MLHQCGLSYHVQCYSDFVVLILVLVMSLCNSVSGLFSCSSCLTRIKTSMFGTLLITRTTLCKAIRPLSLKDLVNPLHEFNIVILSINIHYMNLILLIE